MAPPDRSGQPPCHRTMQFPFRAVRVIDDRIAEERRLGARSRREVLLAGELSDADVAEIAATKMDPRHNHLNNGTSVFNITSPDACRKILRSPRTPLCSPAHWRRDTRRRAAGPRIRAGLPRRRLGAICDARGPYC